VLQRQVEGREQRRVRQLDYHAVKGPKAKIEQIASRQLSALRQLGVRQDLIVVDDGNAVWPPLERAEVVVDERPVLPVAALPVASSEHGRKGGDASKPHWDPPLDQLARGITTTYRSRYCSGGAGSARSIGTTYQQADLRRWVQR